MKHYVFLALLFAGIIFATPARALELPNTLTLPQKIQLLQQEIVRLQALLVEIMAAQPQPFDAAQDKDISAQSYLVMDISNSSAMLQKNAGQAYPIASITKLMNAVITLENIDTSQTITLTESMLKSKGYSPALFLGLNVSANNLLKAMLIQSTNDAAEALTYFVGNEKFIGLMNKKAQDLGMANTYYYDAHGLNLTNHSTASDLAKLLAYIYQNHPQISEITKVNGFQMPSPEGQPLTFLNLNVFSKSPDFLGGKTGYLPEAKQSLAGLFNINGKTMAIVLLKTSNHRADTLKLIDWAKNNN